MGLVLQSISARNEKNKRFGKFTVVYVLVHTFLFHLWGANFLLLNMQISSLVCMIKFDINT